MAVATVRTEARRSAAAKQRLKARLSLEFERSAVSRQTILSASFQEPPLRVIRAFDTGDKAALVHLHNVSGGLLGGDALELSIKVGEGAEAQVTTTGATRIYRPRSEAADTTQNNEIDVGNGGLLELVPDAIIPFAGARFVQCTRIRLGVGAGLFWWEIMAPGRAASGEEFAYERLEWATEIRINERLVAAERARLEPTRFSPRHPARLGTDRYLGTFYACREGMDTRSWTTAEERLREIATELSRESGAKFGISSLVSDGLVIRALARDGAAIATGLRVLWSAAKRILYGREAIWPRKVN